MKIYIFFIALLMIGCNDKIAGTLGTICTYESNCNSLKLQKCLEELNNSKKFVIPKNMEKYDVWDEAGYNFLKGYTFYNKDNNEIYYVTILYEEGNKNTSKLSIRSIFKGDEKYVKWFLFDDLSKSEIKNIELEFRSKILSNLKINCECNDFKIVLLQ